MCKFVTYLALPYGLTVTDILPVTNFIFIDLKKK